MRRRSSLSVTAVTLCLASLGGGCDPELGPAQCVVDPVSIPGSPLTLMSRARLDRIGNAFVLMGSDGNTVRWASLAVDGRIGIEHQVAVPTHVDGPWFAVAGTGAPANRVVVAYGAEPAMPGTGMLDLMTISVPFDGGTPSAPVMIERIADRRSASVQVAMGSGRAGLHAGITWGTRGTTTIMALVLGGDGRVAVGPLNLGTVPDFDCLRFSPGKQDMTIGFVKLEGTPPTPTFIGTEINESGSHQFFSVQIRNETPGCVEVAPTEQGYGLAWRNVLGLFLGVITLGSTSTSWDSHLVASSVQFPAGAPPLGGVGWMGKDYAMVLDLKTGGEAWRVDFMGRRKGVGTVFPSTLSHVGGMSTQQMGVTSADAKLYATYADYDSADPSRENSGHRYLVALDCQ